jgi:hypothetical protein
MLLLTRLNIRVKRHCSRMRAPRSAIRASMPPRIDRWTSHPEVDLERQGMVHERWSTGVLQPAHVGRRDVARHFHAKPLTSLRALNPCHAPPAAKPAPSDAGVVEVPHRRSSDRFDPLPHLS